MNVQLKDMELISDRLPVWRSLTIGVYKAPDSYVDALLHLDVEGAAMLMVCEMTSVKDQQELDLVVVSSADLGLACDSTYADLYAKAVAMGLRLCPEEVGPALVLDCRSTIGPECLRIAMNPILLTGHHCYESIFVVEKCPSGLRLDSKFIWHNHAPKHRPLTSVDRDSFAFVKPRK